MNYFTLKNQYRKEVARLTSVRDESKKAFNDYLNYGRDLDDMSLYDANKQNELENDLNYNEYLLDVVTIEYNIIKNQNPLLSDNND